MGYALGQGGRQALPLSGGAHWGLGCLCPEERIGSPALVLVPTSDVFLSALGVPKLGGASWWAPCRQSCVSLPIGGLAKNLTCLNQVCAPCSHQSRNGPSAFRVGALSPGRCRDMASPAATWHANRADLPPGACEMRHESLLELLESSHGQALHHRLTAEYRMLPASGEQRWQLGFSSEGMGFLNQVPDEVGGDPVAVWANDLLRISLWQCGDEVMCLVKGEERRFVCALEDLKLGRQAHYVSWESGGQARFDSLALRLDVRRSGAYVFWQWRHVARSLALSLADGWHKRRWTAIQELMASVGLPEDQILGSAATWDASAEEALVGDKCLSTVLLLAVLALFARRMQRESDRVKVLSLLDAFLCRFAGEARFHVQLGGAPIELRCEAGRFVSGSAKHLFGPLQGLTGDAYLVPACFLRDVCAMGSAGVAIFRHCAGAFAMEAEMAFDKQEWPTSPLVAGFTEASRIDPNLRAELSKVARTGFIAARVAKALGAAAVEHRSWVDMVAQYRYYVASRQEFEHCVSLAVALDGKRIAAKERFMSAAMNVDTGISCWAPPQAHSGRRVGGWGHGRQIG